MMQYGDEIGIGDNLRLPERECARAPMQWTSEPHGGFSRAKKIVRPVIDDPVYGFRKLSVAAQRRDAESLLNWTERMIRARKECPEISWGGFVVLHTNAPEVLAIRYDWRDTSLLTLHNFTRSTQKVRFKVGGNATECWWTCSMRTTVGPTTTAPTGSSSSRTDGAGCAWGRPTTCWIDQTSI